MVETIVFIIERVESQLKKPQIFHPKMYLKEIHTHFDDLGPSIQANCVFSIRGMQANVLRFFHFSIVHTSTR